MKRLLFSAAALMALAPAIAAAQTSRDCQGTTWFGPRAGSQEVTLSGTGSNDRRFDNGNFGVTGSYGYFFTDGLEAGVRQSINWASVENADDSFNGSTRLAVDYHFNAGGRLRPFIGANIGAIYGDGVADTGIIGPEIGLKYFVNSTTFVLLQTEYQYFFDNSDDVADNFDDGAFVHTVGLGFTF
jgi:hypothetical protein